jgi:hypothetical protein
MFQAFPTVTRHASSLSCSTSIGTERNRWITSAFVVVCRDGLVVRNEPRSSRSERASFWLVQSGHGTSATCGKKAVAPQFQLYRWAHEMDEWHEASGQEIEWRRHRVMRSAFQSQRAMAGGGQKSRKDSLQYERGASGSAYRRAVIARRGGSRGKLQGL